MSIREDFGRSYVVLHLDPALPTEPIKGWLRAIAWNNKDALGVHYTNNTLWSWLFFEWLTSVTSTVINDDAIESNGRPSSMWKDGGIHYD